MRRKKQLVNWRVEKVKNAQHKLLINRAVMFLFVISTRVGAGDLK